MQGGQCSTKQEVFDVIEWKLVWIFVRMELKISPQ